MSASSNPTGLRRHRACRAQAAQGRVKLTWRTANEAQLVGFHLQRETADGASQPIHAALLPAQHAGANQGAAYAFTDAPAPGAYTYILEAVQTDGQRAARRGDLGAGHGSHSPIVASCRSSCRPAPNGAQAGRLRYFARR